MNYSTKFSTHKKQIAVCFLCALFLTAVAQTNAGEKNLARVENQFIIQLDEKNLQEIFSENNFEKNRLKGGTNKNF